MYGSVDRVRKSERYTFQIELMNLGRMFSHPLTFFSGAVTIVIPWTDDQIVRCGLGSLGRGRLEQMVAIGAVWVRDACVFRKLHFGAVKSLHIFHALCAFPVAVHRVLFFRVVMSCEIADAKGSV